MHCNLRQDKNLTVQLEDGARGRVRRLVFFFFHLKALGSHTKQTTPVLFSSCTIKSHYKASHYTDYPAIFLVTICPLYSQRCIRYFAFCCMATLQRCYYYYTGYFYSIVLIPTQGLFLTNKIKQLYFRYMLYCIQYSTCERFYTFFYSV